MFCKELGHKMLVAELCSLFQHVSLISIGRGEKNLFYTLSQGQNSENNRGTVVAVCIIQIAVQKPESN